MNNLDWIDKFTFIKSIGKDENLSELRFKKGFLLFIIAIILSIVLSGVSYFIVQKMGIPVVFRIKESLLGVCIFLVFGFSSYYLKMPKSLSFIIFGAALDKLATLIFIEGFTIFGALVIVLVILSAIQVFRSRNSIELKKGLKFFKFLNVLVIIILTLLIVYGVKVAILQKINHVDFRLKPEYVYGDKAISE